MSDNRMMGNDERTKKLTLPASRNDRGAADTSRTEQDGTALSLAERRAMLRKEWDQEILPQPPAKEGWHFCWLSTTNSADPIFKRVQRGYVPVKTSELPGFCSETKAQGEYEGIVACNEMLLFKIEEEIYQDLMSYFHFEKPMEEEEYLKANLTTDDRDSNGRPLSQREGFDTLARKVAKPKFQ